MCKNIDGYAAISRHNSYWNLRGVVINFFLYAAHNVYILHDLMHRKKLNTTCFYCF